jgi:hypothetical protein
VKIMYFVEDEIETGGGVTITMKPGRGDGASIDRLRESTESWLVSNEYHERDECGHGDYSLTFDLRSHPFLVLTFFDGTFRGKKLDLAGRFLDAVSVGCL